MGRSGRPPYGGGMHRASVCRAVQIHWFSIFNSFMMVIFLVGLVSMILMRTLRKDYARYNLHDAEEFDDLERYTPPLPSPPPRYSLCLLLL